MQRRATRARRRVPVLVVAAMLVAACSGAPRPGQEVAAGDAERVLGGARTGVGGGAVGADADGDGVPDAPIPGQAVDPATGAPVGGTGLGGGASGGDGGTTGGAGPVAPGGFRSTLFTDKEDRVGITDTEIRLCVHAALTYGAAFNTGEEDLNVYWTAVNEAGGVHGRQVRTYYENDNYSPDTAVQAATACKSSRDPFMVLGGIGFDQIPAVRVWAEQNRMLYFHHTATTKNADGLRFSYTGLPTTEKVGEMFAELAASRFAGKKIGIIKRGSENWEPGVDGFKRVAARHGVNVVFERQVQVNKGNYLQDIIDMRNAGTEVAWIWLNALETTELIKQTHAQNFRPHFMVFPFNLTSQTIGADALNPPITGVAMFNAYSQGDRSGEFARYADDLQQFEEQYRRYRPNVDLGGVGGDLLFLNWSAQKAMHQLLERCGRDCTRNRFLEVLHGFKAQTNSSACELDYTRPGPGNDRRGGWSVSIMETYRAPDGKVNFRNTATCAEHVV